MGCTQKLASKYLLNQVKENSPFLGPFLRSKITSSCKEGFQKRYKRAIKKYKKLSKFSKKSKDTMWSPFDYGRSGRVRVFSKTSQSYGLGQVRPQETALKTVTQLLQ